MNSPDPSWDVRLDRLVDGELNGAEYREFLASLDEEPGGWRRCALAFLEAHALQRDVSALCRPNPQAVARSVIVADRHGHWLRVAPWLLTSLATLLVAFVLGWAVRGQAVLPQAEWLASSGANLPRGVPVAQHAPAVPASVAQASLSADNPDAPSNSVPLGESVQAAAEGVAPDKITLRTNEVNGASQEIQLPVFPWDRQLATLMLEAEHPVPQEVQRALQRLGYEVRRDRSWTPVHAEGRRVFVPLEHVEITPVSARAY